MAVSPYETVGIFSLKSKGVTAASTGTFGLVVGTPSNLQDMSFADQKKQMLKQGADVVVRDVSEVHASMLNRWYDSGIHEDAWNLVYTAYNPEAELYREALTCLGNGYMGNRGCFEGTRKSSGCRKENGGPAPCAYPGTYVGGVFNTVEGEPGLDAPVTSQVHPLPLLYATQLSPPHSRARARTRCQSACPTCKRLRHVAANRYGTGHNIQGYQDG